MTPTPLLRTILAFIAGVVAWLIFPFILGILYTNLLPGDHSVYSVPACMFGVVMFSFQPITAIVIFSLLLPRSDKATIIGGILPLALLCCIGGALFCVIFPIIGAEVTATTFPIALAVMLCGCVLGSLFGYYLASRTNHPLRDLIGQKVGSTMRRPLVIPGTLSAIVFFGSMLMFNHHGQEGGEISLGDLIAVITIWPLLLLAAVLSFYSLVRLLTFQHPLAFLLILFLSTTPFRYMVAATNKQNQLLVEGSKCEIWRLYGMRLNPLIIDYVLENTSKVTFTGNYDIAHIAGLGDYLRSQEKDIPVKGDDIIDPWGDPIQIIVEHSRPGMLIEGPKTVYGVWSQNGNKIAVGLYEPNPHSLSVSDNEQWRVQIVPN
jgi:hypothetical protein